jgi:chemotaxis response regulator CheB
MSTPVVMISSLTGRILRLQSGSGTGAVDFFLKNTLANPIGDEASANELRNKIVTASRIKSAKPAANPRCCLR